ncbi:MAG: PASTA domain-containing protein, partial [Actinobacteria bacterium]|nr:PASTA domain-containing protein [Actinomycetota bacterium]
MRSRISIGGLAAAAAALVGAVALTGCVAQDPDPAPAPSLRPVRLQITAPADQAIVRGDTVDVRGRVTPAVAQVTVLGRPALVTQGRFSAVVPLEPGVNVLDVIATAPRRKPALTALRVTRDVLVTVPQLAGVEQDELEGVLEPLGLRAEVQRGGGILDLLRPGEPAVCAQDPEPGTRVRRGRSVRVVVAKR